MTLSPTQLLILKELAKDGPTYEEAAHRLGVTARRVTVHMSNALQANGSPGVLNLVLRFLSEGCEVVDGRTNVGTEPTRWEGTAPYPPFDPTKVSVRMLRLDPREVLPTVPLTWEGLKPAAYAPIEVVWFRGRYFAKEGHLSLACALLTGAREVMCKVYFNKGQRAIPGSIKERSDEVA